MLQEDSAKVAGVRVAFHRYAFAFLTAAAVAAAIPIAGVLVLSSMIAIPVATALQLKLGFRATFWSAIGISLFVWPQASFFPASSMRRRAA